MLLKVINIKKESNKYQCELTAEVITVFIHQVITIPSKIFT